MIADLAVCYTAILIKLQLVLCLSILFALDTPAPQAAGCSSRFHAIELQKASYLVGKQQIQTLNPRQLIEHNG